MSENTRPQPSAEPVAVWREDFSRLTLQHNLEKIIRDGRDTHPDTLLRRIMDAIPVGAYPYRAATSAVQREPVADWLQECTDGRVSSHTITMLNAFRRWYDEYRVNPALEAARREALEVAIRLVSTVAHNCRLDMIIERYGEEATEYAADLLTDCAQRLTALKENPNAG